MTAESPFLRLLMRTAATASMWLFRNNTGLFYTRDGRPVRCGLCTGSSDAVGWTEYVVQPADVGRTLAVFTAFETKTATGRVTVEQQAFIDAVRRSGGIADVIRACDVNELRDKLKGYTDDTP